MHRVQSPGRSPIADLPESLTMPDRGFHAERIAAAEIVLPAAPFDASLAFFTGRLGFRLVSIYPADAPAVAVVAGHGLRLRLDRDAGGDPGTLRLASLTPESVAGGALALTAPGGTRIEIVHADPPLALPPLRQHLVVTRVGDGAPWHVGRAGLRYRDLLPDRLGGRFIASHIRIDEAGPVPDYVHFHKVRFQMIFCRRGWVRVVYEDQGAPFVMQAGDCVLQPPRIRHRVLESSQALEVVEIACPALHETFADPGLELPNGRVDAARDFSGQRFVRHVAADSPAGAWRVDGFAARDLGIGAATGGLAGARVVRTLGARTTPALRHQAEFQFLYVLAGSATLRCEGVHALGADDACSVPAGADHALADCSADFECLEVTLPDQPDALPA
jgi:mannose-6-phosphate isomerase-like protein (cupin superfamily)